MTQPQDLTPLPPLPVVFVHGTRVSRTMWQPVMEIVGEHREVGAPDLPGHGSRRGERFTMDGAVDAVAAAVDELGGRALLVGLSLGGYASLAAAARHPERVAGVLAIGCTAVPRGPLVTVYRLMARLAGRYPEAGNRLSARSFRRMLPVPAAEAMGAGGLSCEVVAEVVEAIVAMDPLAAVAAYPGPIWLANGSTDQLRGDQRAFLAACRDGRLTVWPGHGHLSPLGVPRMLARAVRDAALISERTEWAERPAVGTSAGSPGVPSRDASPS
ncbi:alpha/beta fold hydrolase [Streptomyces sp. NPDC051561]|uniref:alpha/beta fold hydrolase n=1 Tax=Streptomyces sp. NPDC051561 TaxID=3365658 RepID=UPI00379D9B4E